MMKRAEKIRLDLDTLPLFAGQKKIRRFEEDS